MQILNRNHNTKSNKVKYVKKTCIWVSMLRLHELKCNKKHHIFSNVLGALDKKLKMSELIQTVLQNKM